MPLVGPGGLEVLEHSWIGWRLGTLGVGTACMRLDKLITLRNTLCQKWKQSNTWVRLHRRMNIRFLQG